jgi:class 3 adenylate cyclase
MSALRTTLHIFVCKVSFGGRDLSRDMTDAEFPDLVEIMAGLRDTLRMHGGEIAQTVGEELTGSFKDAAMVIPAVTASLLWLKRSPVGERNRAGLRVAVHYGEVVHNSPEIFGDNYALTMRLATRSPLEGVFLTAPAAEALPPQDRERLTKREVSHGKLKPELQALLGAPEVYELLPSG